MQKLHFALLIVILSGSLIGAEPILSGSRSVPVESTKGMVVTSHTIATEVALKVLKKGGNAIDAAVTAGFALAVTQPRSGNIGGGGFMLISSEKKQEVVSIDYREKAPAAATRDMFLDKTGAVDPQLSRFSRSSAGVPGTVAGLVMALEKYGTIPLAEALAPAIELAEKGFVVTPRFSNGIKSEAKRLLKHEAGKKKFLKQDGSFYEPGDIFVQPDLANTLKRIADKGLAGFYAGETADLIVAEMNKGNGLITLEDLQSYQPKIRKPVHGTYRGYDIYSMGPPSSGGVHIIQILNILEKYPITNLGHLSAKTIHLMVEAMKRAYADRAKYLGDSDFVDVPLAGLSSKDYAATLRTEIDPHFASNSQAIRFGDAPNYESDETTHFSIVDQYGNAVSNTYTINFRYGSGIVVTRAWFFTQ